eukprot:6484778-Prymnesium_polylepis.1
MAVIVPNLAHIVPNMAVIVPNLAHMVPNMAVLVARRARVRVVLSRARLARQGAAARRARGAV